MAKLTEAKVRRIRSLYATGDYTQKSIGKFFGVCTEQIRRVCLRKTWKHVK